MLNRKAILTLIAVSAALALGYRAMTHSTPATDGAKPAAPAATISSRAVEIRPMPVRVTAVGNVQSAQVVNVRPRVEGEVVQVHFREGQDVKEGDPLFTLDSRPFEAARRQAEANFARDKAQLDRAKTDQARYSELNKSGYASKQKLEQTTSDLGVLQATLKADQAAIETARLNLDYAAIRAPIGGRTGTINAKLGNLAKPGDGQPMVSITQIQPITVAFSVAELYLPRLRAAMAAGPVTVFVTSTADPGMRADGTLTFVDSSIDVASATIALKATFANDDQRLWPGQFVNVTLVLGTESDALTIPAEAVQTGQSGQYVYILPGDGTAALTQVVVDRVIDGVAVIRSGVKAGDKVVVEGQMRLTNGSKVQEKQDKSGTPQ